MRAIDPVIKSRLLLMQQTLYYNAQPSMEVLAIRPRTPIFHKRFWQESIVAADTTATCTSVAVRKTGVQADRVFVAYISNDVLTIKSAALVFPVANMAWEIEQVIEDCTACALEFDGRFVRISPYKIEYRTEDLPWLFYITTSGALMGGVLSEAYETLVGANVSSVDAIRGIHSEYDDNDLGLIIFYILNGVVYYNQRVGDEWIGQESVSIAPANAISVKAERSFDWRLVLQVTDNTGALYEVFSKAYVSGWTGVDSLTAKTSLTLDVMEVIYHDAMAPDETLSVLTALTVVTLWGVETLMISAVNIDNGEGDYGYLVRITWDHDLSVPPGNDTAFLLTDSEDNTFGSVQVSRVAERVVEVEFQNFNNAIGACEITYTPGTLVGEAGQAITVNSVVFLPTGLVPIAVDPPVPTGIINILDWSVT